MKWFIVLLGLLAVTPALAQNPTCPTRPVGDSSNACASTAFVQTAVGSGTTLLQNRIFVGNASNIATGVAMSGDCTIVAAGTIICTKLNNVSPGTIWTQNANNVAITGGSGAFTTALTLTAATDIYAGIITNATNRDAALTSFNGTDGATVGLLGASCGTSLWGVYYSGCRFIINSAGQIGIGITSIPAWSSGDFPRVVQIGSIAMTQGAADNAVFFGNIYFNGTNFRYINSNYATLYSMGGGTGGTHAWWTAPSGTAGNNATLTTRMTLTNTGNLGIGTTSPGALLDVASTSDTYANITTNATNKDAAITFLNGTNTPSTGLLGATCGASLWGVYFSGCRMVINSSGQVSIGTTTPATSSKLTISDTGAASAYHSVQITRTEAISSDTQGAQNAALNIDVTGNNTSVVGPPAVIAQPVAARFYAHQTGSGDAVGSFSIGESNSSGVYAAFGSFATAVANTATAGAISFGTGTGNNTGQDRTWSGAGPWLFVGIDLPYSSYGTANKGDAAAIVRKTDTGTWACGFCVADSPNAVGTYAFYSNGFNVTAAGAETALSNTATSDERLKNLLGPSRYGLADILKINPIRYTWKAYPEMGEQVGLSAQDVQHAIPEAISEKKDDGMLGVSDRPIVAALINAVKEQQACLDSWKCRIFGWR